MTNCPKCNQVMIGIEYPMTHHNYYDGISEWHGVECNYRVGRWSGRELSGYDTEDKMERTRHC